MQKLFWFVVKLGISIALLAWLFNTAKEEKQFDGLFEAKKQWTFLILGLTACLAAHAVSYYRWHIMARAIGFSLSAWEAIKIGLIGTFFNLVAFGVIGGDSLRAFYAARQSREKIPEAISSVFADRVIGLLSMFGVAIVAFNLKDFSALDANANEKLDAIKYFFRVFSICYLLGVFALLALFFSPSLREFRLVKWAGTIRFVGPLISKVMEVISLYQKKPGTIFICIGLSVITNLLFVVSVFFTAYGLVESYPSFADHFVVVPVSLVANAVPLPGGLGGMEAALTFLYKSFTDASTGIESQGFVVALGFRLGILFVSVLGGLFWAAYRKETTMTDPSATEAGDSNSNTA